MKEAQRFVVRTVTGYLGDGAGAQRSPGLSALVIDTGYSRDVAVYRSEDRLPRMPELHVGDAAYGRVCKCGNAKSKHGRVCAACGRNKAKRLGHEGALRAAEAHAARLNQWANNEPDRQLGPLGSLLGGG